MGRDKQTNMLWHCVCDCGGVAITRSFMLNNGRTRSCGCWHRDRVSGHKIERFSVTEKKCSGCGEIKPAALFGERKGAPDGLKSHCRYCANVQYKRAHKGAVNAAHAARKAAIKRATPPWANMRAIKEIYDDAARLTEESGIAHHVDHVVPILGVNVCGLHLPWNLQPIPATENCSKQNRLVA